MKFSLIEQFSRQTSPSIARGCLFRTWIDQKNIDLSTITSAPNINKLIEPVTKEDYEKFQKDVLNYQESRCSLKELEGYIEILMSHEHKKNHGTVFTPDYIIDYLLLNALKTTFKKRNHLPKICDPSCGYGGFLIRAAEILNKTYQIGFKEIFQDCLWGLDLHEETLLIAKGFIELYLISKNIIPKSVRLNLYTFDTLSSDREEVLNTVGVAEGFDIVATNPPYIKLQNLQENYRRRLEKRYPEFSHGSYSTAMLFLIAGHKLLSHRGCLAYITQNNLFTSLAGRFVRQYIKDNRCILRIVDFGHGKIFDKVNAYTCLIFLSSIPSDDFEFVRISRDISPATLNACKFSRIQHANLQTSKWRLATGKQSEILRILESKGVPLGNLCHIRVGFATLKDRVYFVETDESVVWGQLPSGERTQIEMEATRPAIKIADFDDELQLPMNSRRIIFPYEKKAATYRPIIETEFREKYPKCYEYLLAWQSILRMRDKGKSPIVPWYAWGRTQALDAPGPKLLTKTFSAKPNFLYDSSSSLFCNGYAIFERKSEGNLFVGCPIPLTVVQRILNGQIMDFYVRNTSFQIDGDFQCYQKNFIERFCIPRLSLNDQETLMALPDSERDIFVAQLYGISLDAIQEAVLS